MQQLARSAAAAGALASDLPSPCVSVCRMEAESGLCTGCLRTIEEIAGWSRIDDDAKRSIWRAIELRALLPIDLPHRQAVDDALGAKR